MIFEVFLFKKIIGFNFKRDAKKKNHPKNKARMIFDYKLL